MKMRTIIVAAFGSYLFYKVWLQKSQDTFFDIFIFLGLGIFGLVFLINTFSKDKKAYKLTRNRKSYLSTFVFMCLVIPSLVLGWKIHYNYTKPSLIVACIKVDFGNLKMDLKEDGTFVFTNTFFIAANYNYGMYSISGDTIILDRTEIDNVIHSNKMVLKEKEVEYKDGLHKELYLVELNAKPNNIYSDYIIIEDNR